MIKLENIQIEKPISIKGEMELEKGKIYLIQGVNGVGKTTLFYQLALLENLQCDYYLDHKKLKNNQKLLSNIRKQKMGIVLQNDDLQCDLTCQQFICLMCVLYKIKQEDVYSKMSLLHLDIRKSISITKLSGGQKAKLLILLAIAKNPEYLLLDEPTSSLDDKSTQQVIELLLENKEKMTICMVSHDKRLIPIVDKVYSIENGQVKGNG